MNENKDKEALAFLISLRNKALEAGPALLNRTIPKLQAYKGEWPKEVLWEFLENCMNVCCFFNQVIIDQLKLLGLSSYTLKWFIKGERIWNELERIEQTGTLRFSKLEFFAAIHFHIQNKVFVSILDDLGLLKKYNGKENVNTTTETYIKFFQRREYQQRNYSTKENSELVNKLNHVVDRMRDIVGSENEAKKTVIALARGKTAFYLSHLNNFNILNGSRSQCYAILFDLIKLVVKDENFLNEESYRAQEKYDRSFNAYKVAMVKKYITI